MTSYSEKLRDPRWQKKRLGILNRDEWHCQICFDGENTLHVHHRDYTRGREPWEYDDKNLVTLCYICHQEETDLYNNSVVEIGKVIKRYGGYSHQIDRIAEAFLSVTDESGLPVILVEPDFSDIEDAIKAACKRRLEFRKNQSK